MQHTLLGLAIALILAIMAALTAPAYVNWNDWRGTFESHAAALTGAPVRIRGRIEASILPTPAFVFRDVTIGDPDKGTGIRVSEVRGILALGPLLRGVLEAEEFVLSRPALRLAKDPDGRPVLAGVLATARATGVVALARLTVERGSLVVQNRASGELMIFDEISADGEVRAREGPMRIDATFLRDGRRWNLRANAGRFGEEGAGRVRLTLERAADGTLFDAEGTLALGNGNPRFEGKVSASRRRASEMPWQINASAKASETSVSLDGFMLTVGASAAPIDLSGQVQFEPRRDGRIEGALRARRVDLDLASGGGEAMKGLSGAATALRDVFVLFNELPLQGRIDVSADAVIAGGGTVRDVKAELALRENTLALGRLEARLPGRGSLIASGSSTGSAIFNGDAVLEAEDASALMRWAVGDSTPVFSDGGGLRLAGMLQWTRDEIAIDGLELAFEQAKVGGRIGIEPGDGRRRTRVRADLSATGLDLDRFAPIIAALHAGSDAADVALAIQARDLRVLGRPLASIEASVTRWGRALTVERFVVDDFDGVSGLARGRVTGSVERPSGRIDFELEVKRPGGIAAIVEPLLGEEAAQLSRFVGGVGSIRVFGAAIGAGAAAGVELTASGYVGEVELSAAAHFDTLAGSLSEASVALESSDAAKLIGLFGAESGGPASGRGDFELLFAKADDGKLPVTAKLVVPGGKLSMEGELRQSAEGRIDPHLEFRLAADDVRPLLAAARGGNDTAVTGEGRATLSRKGGRLLLERIGLDLGGSSVKGELAIGPAEEAVVTGNLAVEHMHAATLLALLVGSTQEGDGAWSAARLQPALLAGLTGKIDVTVKEFGLVDQLAAAGARFQLRLAANEMSIEEFSGELAGGKLTGGARFVRGSMLGFDGRGTLAAFSVERLLAPLERRPALRGRGDLALTIAGNGATPAAVVGSLAGQGTLALEMLEIDRLDPNAIHAVLAATKEPRDEIGVVAALAPEFAKGPLRIEKVEAPLIVAGGVVRASRTRARAGPAQVTAEGNLDVGRFTFEAGVEIEVAPPEDLTIRPAAAVRWHGPLGSPERTIEAASLATAIALRAMDRETKRIEERDRALPKRSEPSSSATEAQPAAGAPPVQERPDAGLPTASVPASEPPRAPARQGQPQSGSPSSATALPPLAPPIDIRPAPRVFTQPER